MKKIVSSLQLTPSLNSRTTTIAGALLTMLFSGCTLGPDFTRPARPGHKKLHYR